jgi:hypothetical protein
MEIAPVVLSFEQAVVSPRDRTRYWARACALLQPDGLWEGWIECEPVGSGSVVRTGREATSRTRDELARWASGLSAAYLQRALERALDRHTADPLGQGSTAPQPGTWLALP